MKRFRRALVSFAVRLSIAALFASLVFTAVASAAISEFPIPTEGAGPIGITAGPDGALWFTETNADKIGRVTTSGSFTEFPIPTAGGGPREITQGPDGALWFTEGKPPGPGLEKIGRITTSGTVTEFPIPSSATRPVASFGITAGPDGALWFTERFAIGRITTSGSITEFPTFGMESGITVGSDGALWFANQRAIGRITTSGSITEFPLPPDLHGGPSAGPTAGPDGALWFGVGRHIVRSTTSGSVSQFTIPASANRFVHTTGITAGPDGNLWFTEYSTNMIGCITTAGSFTEFPIPTSNSFPFQITAGPDGALWFTEQGANKIGRITAEGCGTPPPNPPPDCSKVAGNPSLLWPPNHKYRLITLSGATDPDDDPVTLTITGVTQDEPFNGLGDGDTSPDAKNGPTSNKVYVRSERSGLRDGRVYRIAFTGSDGKGGTCSGTALVGVPHDMGKGRTPIDSAPSTYNSFGP